MARGPLADMSATRRIHYFRVHPELWEDRLMRLKAMGLNTIEV